MKDGNPLFFGRDTMASLYFAEQSAKFAFAMRKIKQSKVKWNAVKDLDAEDLIGLLPYWTVESPLFRSLPELGCDDWALYNECVEWEREGHTEDAVREIKDERSSHKRYGFPDEVLTHTEFLARVSNSGRDPEAIGLLWTHYAFMRKADEEWRTFVPPSTE